MRRTLVVLALVLCLAAVSVSGCASTGSDEPRPASGATVFGNGNGTEPD